MSRTHDRILWNLKQINEFNLMCVTRYNNLMVEKLTNEAINLNKGVLCKIGLIQEDLPNN